jgi:hypothetical protein
VRGPQSANYAIALFDFSGNELKACGKAFKEFSANKDSVTTDEIPPLVIGIQIFSDGDKSVLSCKLTYAILAPDRRTGNVGIFG